MTYGKLQNEYLVKTYILIPCSSNIIYPADKSVKFFLTDRNEELAYPAEEGHI